MEKKTLLSVKDQLFDIQNLATILSIDLPAFVDFSVCL